MLPLKLSNLSGLLPSFYTTVLISAAVTTGFITCLSSVAEAVSCAVLAFGGIILL